MEKWQVDHINKNLVDLVRMTKFNWIVEARLVQNDVLNKETDVEWLKAQKSKDGTSEACKLYYEKLLTRAGSYKVLYNALVETNQSGAARMLVRVPPELFSRPLTYLGISLEVNEFYNVQMEVNGKAFEVHEFLPLADYKMVQRIFQETISEVDFYDYFITKERTFVLSKNTIPAKPSYYVPRFLSNRIKLDQSIFQASIPDVFVFKNSIARYKLSAIAKPHFTETSSTQLTHITCRFIYLDDNEDWIELRKLAKSPIHLINYEQKENIFLLEDSSAPSNILKKLGSNNERVYMSEEDFVQQQLSVDCTSSRVCICDTPGMGKTCLLANIACHMTERCIGRIIVFIQLTTFATGFCPGATNALSEPETSLTNILNYTRPPKQNPELLLELVKAKLTQLQIFFDGFDELPTEQVEWTKQVFGSITMKFPNVSIYITARPHLRQELEKSLGVVAYDILPFNQQNQVDFLVQFWQKNNPESDQLSLERYATSCLDAVNESLTKNDKKIAEIPLLCQLIAEVYSDKAACRLTKRRKLFDVPSQKFIEKRINLVSKNEESFEKFKVHVWHSLKLFFPTKYFHDDNLFDNVKDLLTSAKLLKMGILQKHSNGVLEFIHRTFAEYLVADFLNIKLQGKKTKKNEEMNRNSISILKFLFQCKKHSEGDYKCEIYYNFVHPVIVSFFNSVLGEIGISEEMKIHVSAFISAISHEEFISIICACCQYNLFNVFSFLRELFTNWDNCRLLECFSNRNSYELLRVSIVWSTSQIFHSCIQLLSEKLQLDMAQITTFNNANNLLNMAVQHANYEAVEYFVHIVSLKNDCDLAESVCHSDNIEKRENIAELLLTKEPTLIHKRPDILVTFNTKIDVRLFKILVKFGANLTAVNGKLGCNCVVCAANYMSPSDFHELVQFLLIDCKADYLFVENEKWKDPLPRIIQWATLLPETLELLLNIPGIDINIKYENGENLLYCAAEGNKLDNLQQLVVRGVDYNTRGKKNRSLLHVAAEKYEGVEMVRYLLSLKLDPNSRDDNEWTPLHYAADCYDSLSVVKALVENGANLQAKGCNGQTALYLSAANFFYPSIEVMQYLIRKGAGVNDRDNDGNTPLHLCRRKDNMDCLIKMGADIHATNNQGQTALHLSAAQILHSKIEVIKYLIEKGVGVNDRDNDGNTPLHLCREEKVLDCLVEMGADIPAKNKEGQTPAQKNPWLWK